MKTINGDTPLRVLVIEDEAGIRRMLRFSLRQAGFQISEAGTGSEGLRILESEAVDAVVLDLGLPNDEGSAVLAWLNEREERKAAKPVWIVISALDRKEAARRYGRLGSNFLSKPFDPWHLVSVLEELPAPKNEV